MPPPSIIDTAGAVRRGALCAADVVASCLERIAARDGALNCLHETFAERARARAADIDRRVAAGEDPGPLAGAALAIKDNIVTDFGHTTCGSRMLEHFAGPYSSTVVRRLERAGAIVVGKANCDEFGMGSSSEHCAFGAVRNPWDPARVPGGSSGGSAAAVAAGLVGGALGSDTGGSVRQPAALCGVVGVKPSYGRVSRFGLVAFGSSLEQVGPLATNVSDAAGLLGVIAGADPRDSTCADVDVPDYLQGIDEPVQRLRIGVPVQYRSDRNDDEVNEAVDRAVEVYRGLGATVVDLDLPLIEYGIATYYIIAPAEASSNLARYDGVRYGRRAAIGPDEGLDDLYARSRSEGFGPEVQRRIMLGTHVLSSGYYDAYYKRALQVRRLIRDAFARAFADCHVLLGPTAPGPAFDIGAKTDPISMYLCDVYTTVANITGACAISIPGGFARRGGRRLPIGLQLQCPAFDEATMFRAARMFERATTYHTERPPM